jgi:biopolymer transport protein ExbB/TolQ
MPPRQVGPNYFIVAFIALIVSTWCIAGWVLYNRHHQEEQARLEEIEQSKAEQRRINAAIRSENETRQKSLDDNIKKAQEEATKEFKEFYEKARIEHARENK